MSQSSSRLLQGIIVPVVTPLSGADALDVETLERLVEHLLAGGVHGLFLLGTCGEGPSLSYRVRREMISRTCKQVGKRIPIVVGLTDCSMIEAVAIGRHAADEGADAVVVAPPFYFPIAQDELANYVRRVADDSPLPVVLYNMPSLTKVAFEPSQVRRLMDDERFIALKDSSGDLEYFELLLSAARQRNDWSFLVGPEHLLVPSLQLGGHGGVCGGANLFPRLFVDIYEAATSNSSNRLSELWDHVITLGSIYEQDSASAAAAVKGLKAGLHALGFGNGQPAEPLSRLGRRAAETIDRVVARLNREIHVRSNRVVPNPCNGTTPDAGFKPTAPR